MILPPLGEYDVMVQIKACALSRIDTKVMVPKMSMYCMSLFCLVGPPKVMLSACASRDSIKVQPTLKPKPKTL